MVPLVLIPARDVARTFKGGGGSPADTNNYDRFNTPIEVESTRRQCDVKCRDCPSQICSRHFHIVFTSLWRCQSRCVIFAKPLY